MESTHRYKLYALSNMNTPEEQIEQDKVKYPGGIMAGFINFIHNAFDKFCKEYNINRDKKTAEDHKNFDLYLGLEIHAKNKEKAKKAFREAINR